MTYKFQNEIKFISRKDSIDVFQLFYFESWKTYITPTSTTTLYFFPECKRSMQWRHNKVDEWESPVQEVVDWFLNQREEILVL